MGGVSRVGRTADASLSGPPVIGPPVMGPSLNGTEEGASDGVVDAGSGITGTSDAVGDEDSDSEADTRALTF